MDMAEALSDLGVTEDTLSSAEKAQLEAAGYLILHDILSATQLQRFRLRLDQIHGEEGDRAGLEVNQEPGAPRLANLYNKDPIFEICCTTPRVLAAVAHMLQRDFKTNSLNARYPLQGQGLQGLHADFGEAVEPGDYYNCNSFWLIDPFTGHNGSARIVPGTHRSGRHPKDAMADPKARHPEEIILVAPAGSVVVVNGHLWHGGTRNESGERRRVVHGSFVRRDHVQQLTERDYIRPEVYVRMTSAVRYLLDVD